MNFFSPCFAKAMPSESIAKAMLSESRAACIQAQQVKGHNKYIFFLRSWTIVAVKTATDVSYSAPSSHPHLP
jgi:hypothetical protein